MLHPVGSQPSAVYWRRRLLLVASIVLVIVLIVLTGSTLFSGGTGTPAAAGPPATAPATAQPHTSNAGTAHTDATHAGTPAQGKSKSGTPAGSAEPPSSGHSAATPPVCAAAQLSVKAVVGKPQYAIGDQPVLTLQVTNTGPNACVQNVADSQIVLRVYNGASRVWGSHDCKIAPGTDVRTLAVDKPAGFSIVWSGLTSQPKCAGTRQRVGAGTYTLYAALSGHDGRAAQFVIS